MEQKSHPADDQRQAWQDRQAALADFGLQALRASDLDAILQQACDLVARGLGAPIAKVLEWLPGGHALRLRVAVGLPPEIVGALVPGGGGSAAGYALHIGAPVISDVATETRFQISEIVRRYGVRTTANVLIRTEAEPFGVLEVDSREDRAFTPDDLAFLQVYANLLGAAVERQRSGAFVQRLAEERALLLRELQHRVKNDLQVINALLALESRHAESLEVRARLDTVAARVNTLALVYERLFAGGQVGRVDLADYVGTLSHDRFAMHGQRPDGPIALSLDLAELTVTQDQAVAIGLIVNEFLTNSLKYAFPFGSGTVRVALDRPEPHRARLVLADTGIGMPEGRRETPRGMGLELIEMLMRQIGAEAEWSGNPGTRLSLTFPLARP